MTELTALKVPPELGQYISHPAYWRGIWDKVREIAPKDPDGLRSLLYEADLERKWDEEWEKFKRKIYGFLTSIGAENASNEFTVEAERLKCRDLLAWEMAKGKLVLHGDVGDNVGYISGGTIHIVGNAGNYLGSGMTGGEIFVEGDAGSYVGNYMKGGAIKIKGQPCYVSSSPGYWSRSVVSMTSREQPPKVYWNFKKFAPYGPDAYMYMFEKSTNISYEWDATEKGYKKYEGHLQGTDYRL